MFVRKKSLSLCHVNAMINESFRNEKIIFFSMRGRINNCSAKWTREKAGLLIRHFSSIDAM
ncbi:MAG: hypothetical protein JWP81_4263 [Ferruginibacter sp.]|nr:hypothetical protein [Ferruginibacter sp.]